VGAFLAGWVSLRVLARPHKHEESELSMMSGVRVSGGPQVGGTCVWGGVDADAAVDRRLGKIESPVLDECCFQLQLRLLRSVFFLFIAPL
jgi:hypothetical protein